MSGVAVDMDFYTWNAFEETVSAFQRVALVLRDPGFTVFVLVFAVGGILIGGVYSFAQEVGQGAEFQFVEKGLDCRKI